MIEPPQLGHFEVMKLEAGGVGYRRWVEAGTRIMSCGLSWRRWEREGAGGLDNAFCAAGRGNAYRRRLF